jgi:hypothetical protein
VRRGAPSGPFLGLGLISLAFVAGAQTSALSYLQSISDQFQQTVDVYTDADAAGNLFLDNRE